MLRNRLLKRIFYIGTLALNHAQRNAVHEQHNIGTICIAHSRATHSKLLCHVKRIVFDMLPIDVLHHITLLVAIDNLFERFARSHKVVSHLRSGHITLRHRQVAQRLNARSYVLLREYGCALRTHLHGVDVCQLLTQNRL